MTEKKYVKLADIADISAGQSAPQGADNFSDHGLPFIRAGSLPILTRGGEEIDLERIPDEVATNRRLRKYPEDTILFAKSGMSATKGIVYQLKSPCYVVSHLAAIIGSDSVFPHYLTYWLQANPPTRLIRDPAYPSIRLSDIGKIKIPLPPLTEQKRIATILDKADAIHHKHRQAIDLREELLRSTFLDMFGDPAVNPKGWDTKKLFELVHYDDKINYGVVQPGKDFPGGIPIVRVGDMLNGIVDISNLKLIDPAIEKQYKRSRLFGNEILIACVGATMGKIAIADSRLKGMNIVRAVARVRLKDSVHRSYVSEYLKTPFVQHYFQREVRTVAQPTLNINQIKDTPIRIPSKTLQKKFDSSYEKICKVENRHTQMYAESYLLFNSLVQRAFKGAL